MRNLNLKCFCWKHHKVFIKLQISWHTSYRVLSANQRYLYSITETGKKKKLKESNSCSSLQKGPNAFFFFLGSLLVCGLKFCPSLLSAHLYLEVSLGPWPFFWIKFRLLSLTRYPHLLSLKKKFIVYLWKRSKILKKKRKRKKKGNTSHLMIRTS